MYAVMPVFLAGLKEADIDSVHSTVNVVPTLELSRLHLLATTPSSVQCTSTTSH